MPRDFFDPSSEQQNVTIVSTATLRKAERLIASCERCNPEEAEIPFDAILDRVIGSDPSVTHYILESPAKCTNCRREVLEKTLVEPICNRLKIGLRNTLQTFRPARMTASIESIPKRSSTALLGLDLTKARRSYPPLYTARIYLAMAELFSNSASQSNSEEVTRWAA
jgi:hypothetical protein